MNGFVSCLIDLRVSAFIRGQTGFVLLGAVAVEILFFSLRASAVQ